MLGAYVTFMVQQAIRTCGTRTVRRVAADFGAAGIHRCRHRRHHHRAHADPLAVRPAAGNAAGDLGPVAGAATGGALDLRRRQPRRQHAGLDERRDAVGRSDDHLQSALHHHLRGHGAGGADGGAALHVAWPAYARRDTEPAHGSGDGHSHAVDRRADIRPRLGRGRHGRRGAEPDRQRVAQSGPGLHHRQLHGRRVRRRRQSVGHGGRRVDAWALSTNSSNRSPARCWPRSSCWSC